MNSFTKSFLFVSVKIASFFVSLLPMGMSLWIGRCMGWMAYYFLPRKRKVVYANLKTVFAPQYKPDRLRRMTHAVFVNFIQSAVELLCLPKIKRLGLEKFVTLKGKENIDKALGRGKGVIFLAIHSGSWELASVIGSVTNGAYHIMANSQSRLPQLDRMLNDYRRIAGARVIIAGVETRELIKAIHGNEIVSIVLDQGGRLGMRVPFFGNTASMSTGAIRLALKYGCAVCPVWIQREKDGKHILNVYAPLNMAITGDLEKDIKANVEQAVRHFEALLKVHPTEYLWFYKVFKYSNQSKVLILDDGRTGHLRQSQAMATALGEVLKKREKTVEENTVGLQWKGPWADAVFPYYAFVAQYLPFLRNEDCLRFFLTPSSYAKLMEYKADFIVTCGSMAGGVSFILSQNHLARSVAVSPPGFIQQRRFDMVVMPEHDKAKVYAPARTIMPKVSPNLINARYLKEQSEGLMRQYSHLKGNVRTKFGVLIGGDAKGVKFSESKIYQLLDQLKQAALHYNADILLTTSRRTPSNIDQVIARELKGFSRCSLCIIANQRNVPEAVGGILGLSDLVVVSGESISMVSEALSSGRRTIVFSPNGRYTDRPRDKYEEFVLKLNDQGYLMASAVDDIKNRIAQLLSRKISLKALNDQSIIHKGLEAIV